MIVLHIPYATTFKPQFLLQCDYAKYKQPNSKLSMWHRISSISRGNVLDGL